MFNIIPPNIVFNSTNTQTKIASTPYLCYYTNMLEPVQMKNIHKYLQKTVKTKGKLILLVSTILLISAITTTIHIITKPKPNDDNYEIGRASCRERV